MPRPLDAILLQCCRMSTIAMVVIYHLLAKLVCSKLASNTAAPLTFSKSHGILGMIGRRSSHSGVTPHRAWWIAERLRCDRPKATGISSTNTRCLLLRDRSGIIGPRSSRKEITVPSLLDVALLLSSPSKTNHHCENDFFVFVHVLPWRHSEIALSSSRQSSGKTQTQRTV